MTDTPIDRAHAEMLATPDSERARLSYFERVADGELFLLLESEPDGETVTPQIFDTSDGRYALAFDREERLTAFAGGAAAYAALSGRNLATMLNGSGMGLGLNLGTASEVLMSPDEISWLAGTIENRPVEAQDTPVELTPPQGIPETLVQALDAKLATASGLAKVAFLTGATWSDGRKGHLLSIVDPVPGAEPALANAVNEALIFSGIEAGTLDVTFLPGLGQMASQFERVGLRFDLPEAAKATPPSASGMDPANPPKLR